MAGSDPPLDLSVWSPAIAIEGKRNLLPAKFPGSQVGEKLFALSGRGASSAIGGAAAAAVVRRGAKPCALLLAPAFGLTLISDYRASQRAST